ncbi:MAG: GntR family transcriptional regulator, transcriptional repressor for pyruvate dehydrogenase complex [Acetobacteraceae bacterium]|nr:GntR family transcriptional regulator, transcriptional repressor for pyruvate dehydrogenase complex [Acetobacteraceae bacterium]
MRAGHAPTLLCLYRAMAPLLHRTHQERRVLVRRYADIKRYVAEDHERIFEAVVARDEARADAILRKHFAIGDEYRHRAATSAVMP